MRRALILDENLSVPFDRRVWQEAVALRDDGWDVTVICPKTAHDRARAETIDGVSIHRYAVRMATGGPAGYLVEFGTSLLWMWWLSLRLSLRGRFHVVQACNPPDVLFLVALPLKLLFRTRFVFDHHDVVPELFETRFGGRGLLYKIALRLERLTFRCADMVISTNESYRQIAITRGGVAPDRVHVVRNAPPRGRLQRLEADPSLRNGRRFLAAYLGIMGPQDGIDYALRALAAYRDECGRNDLHTIFLGAGDAFDASVLLAKELGLEDRTEFLGMVTDDSVISRVLSTADVCLAPDPKSPSNDISTMIKVMEYMALGRPTVSFDLVEQRESAGDAALYAPDNDTSAFARLLAELLDSPDRREAMGEVGRRRVETDLSWDRSAARLIAAYDTLVPE